MPSRMASRYCTGIVLSNQKTMGCFGGESGAEGSCFFKTPAIDIALAGFEIGIRAVVFDLGEEMPDAVVGKSWRKPGGGSSEKL